MSASATTGVIASAIAPTGGGWTPASLGTLFGWWDFQAANVTKDGSNNMSAVTDLSGSGNNLAGGAGAQQPLWVSAAQNGLDVAQFNFDKFSVQFGALQDNTGPAAVFGFSCKLASAGAGNQCPMGAYNNTYRHSVRLESTNATMLSGSTATGGWSPDTNWHYWVAIWDDSAFTLRKDGAVVFNTTGTSGVKDLDGITLGVDNNGSWDWLVSGAQMGEALVLINDDLSGGTDLADLETYLSRWL